MKVKSVETLACDAGWRNYHFVKITTDTGVWSDGSNASTPSSIARRVRPPVAWSCWRWVQSKTRCTDKARRSAQLQARAVFHRSIRFTFPEAMRTASLCDDRSCAVDVSHNSFGHDADAASRR